MDINYKKMRKIRILFLVSIPVLIFGCTKLDKKEQQKPLVFSYRILEKTDFSFEKSHDNYFNVGSILLNIPDTVVTYISIAECVKDICINENFIAAKFYTSEECWNMEEGKEVMDKEINRKCYIGYIDNISKGLNWKYKIRIEDFKFNDEEGLPFKINVK